MRQDIERGIAAFFASNECAVAAVYTDVDLEVVTHVLEAHLNDLLDFARLIRARLPSPGV